MNFDNKYNTYMVVPHTFEATLVYADRLLPVSYTLKTSCIPLFNQSLPHEEVTSKAEEGFKRLKLWTEAMLGQIVIVNVNSDLFPFIQSLPENIIMYTPGEPDDLMLSAILHSKLTAITRGFLLIGGISLTSSTTDYVERVYHCDDGDYMLPGIEYYKGNPMHNRPWWLRDTIDVCEYEKIDGQDVRLYNTFEDLSPFSFTKDEKEEADIIVFDNGKK